MQLSHGSSNYREKMPNNAPNKGVYCERNTSFQSCKKTSITNYVSIIVVIPLQQVLRGISHLTRNKKAIGKRHNEAGHGFKAVLVKVWQGFRQIVYHIAKCLGSHSEKSLAGGGVFRSMFRPSRSIVSARPAWMRLDQPRGRSARATCASIPCSELSTTSKPSSPNALSAIMSMMRRLPSLPGSIP